MAKMKSSLKEKLNRAIEAEGRTQGYIISKMKEKGIKISDSQFSRKKFGHDKFREEEFEALSEILNIELP